MRFVVDESVEIDKFKDEFIKNKEIFFKTPIFASVKNDEIIVLDGVKRLRCLMDESLNDNLSLLNPCPIDCGSKPYQKEKNFFYVFNNYQYLLEELFYELKGLDSKDVEDKLGQMIDDLVIRMILDTNS